MSLSAVGFNAGQSLLNPHDVVAVQAATRAAEKMAPIWPLDKSVAVNPWWHWRERPIALASAKLRSAHDIRLLMPKPYYRRHWLASILPEHLLLAAREQGINSSVDALVDYLDAEDRVPVWKNLSDWLDTQPEQLCKMPWGEEITHQISQSCGLFFSYPERVSQPSDPAAFYHFWRELIQQDAGVTILMGEPALQSLFLALPDTPEAIITEFYRELQSVTAIDESDFEAYCLALLLDINGWASVFAQHQWLKVPDNECVFDRRCALLAVRLAWEWAIWKLLEKQITPANTAYSKTLQMSFIEQFQQSSLREASCHKRQQLLWVWQRALEISVQQTFEKKLLNADPATNFVPSLQAVFCIDVRSEPMRRALESVSSDIQTLGFAGFFGLAIAYDPLGVGIGRPQLPALLTPSLSARPTFLHSHQRKTLAPLLRKHASNKAGGQASANFGWVEAKGLLDGVKMLGQSFGLGHQSNPQDNFSNIDGWELWSGDKRLTPEEIAGSLAGVLGHMGLTRNFAPRVLMVAHGSCTANNAMAAGLDCGACGGQSGEANVRVLAYFLNLASVRAVLAEKGIDIPDATQFIPCLHNTTSDQIQWLIAPEKATAPEYWQSWLIAAGDNARATRAAAMNITATTPANRTKAFKNLTNDWSQLRPEWGLANNAAFIVAPRSATRTLNLEGRSFLHDYQWQNDTDFATLELIITAPMVVTQWINFQYYASMTDTLHYGSGNKLLHNVVGGNLGVFEGNGGDLRIGLPLQSLHDGKDWRHQPVRLSVYLAAPRHAIAAIVQRHPHIAALINNDWIYVFQWDQNERSISRYYNEQWLALPSLHSTAEREAVL